MKYAARMAAEVKEKIVFHDPQTGEAWAYARITDIRVYWEPTLKRTGIRYHRQVSVA